MQVDIMKIADIGARYHALPTYVPHQDMQTPTPSPNYLLPGWRSSLFRYVPPLSLHLEQDSQRLMHRCAPLLARYEHRGAFLRLDMRCPAYSRGVGPEM
jgi:hypothetical protein